MRLATSILVFIAATVTSATVAALAFGHLTIAIAVGAILGGLCAAAAAWTGTAAGVLRRLSTADACMLAVFALASARAFLWLIYQDGGDWKVLSPNNLGDISKHIQIIRYLAAGAGFWPENPFFSGEPLKYYIGVDLFNSLLSLLGLPVELGLLWVGLICAALAGWALWNWGGAFALAGMVFNGGLAGFAIFVGDPIAENQSDLEWKNLFLSIFVTQRGFLYALPAGLLLVSDWRERYFAGSPRLPQWVACLLYATLPLFAAQAFLALSTVLLSIFIFQPSVRTSLLKFVGFAFVPASFCAWLVTGGFSAHSGIRWLPGWMQEDGGAWFWLYNFGISLPLLGLLGWRIAVENDPRARSFAGAGLALLSASSAVAFAPWPWDNTKIMIWAWLICLPFLLDKVIMPCHDAIRGVCYVILFFSGAFSLIKGLDGTQGYKLIGRNELDQARAALAQIPPLARIATPPVYNNPAVLLGYPVICGYEGMLWAHGIDYKLRWSVHEQVLARVPHWPILARRLSAEWLYLPPSAPVEVKTCISQKDKLDLQTEENSP